MTLSQFKSLPENLLLLLSNPEIVDIELAERYLSHFIKQMWRYIDPAEYIHGWHIDAICEHLEAVSRGQITRLLITVPPRHSKSLIVSVAWPAWTWINYPEKRFFFSSYAGTLSERDSVKCNRLIRSPLYQRRWGDRFELLIETHVKIDNDKGGERLSSSVNGTTIGEGGDIIVGDDLNNVRMIESEVIREGVIVCWREVMSTRLNSPETGAKVLILQRSHQNDIAGYVLREETGEDWVHLNLPTRYEKDRHCKTVIGWEDPRKEEGELLNPKRFNNKSITKLEKVLGIYGTAGQLQQRPSPRGGGLFKVENFVIVNAMPASNRIESSIRYWDKAGTEGGGKRTAGVLMHKLKDGRHLISDIVKGQWSAGPREQRIRQTAELDGVDVTVWVEQEPGSGGKESVENTIRNLAGYKVKKDKVTGDKEVRAEPYADQVEAGNILLLRGEWVKGFVDEHEQAPRGTFKDQWDAAAGAFNKHNVSEKIAGVWGR